MTKQMTEVQATEEALLLILRKVRRMAPTEFARAWGQLPDGAMAALNAAESRADMHRLTNTVIWPEVAEDDEDDEDDEDEA